MTIQEFHLPIFARHYISDHIACSVETEICTDGNGELDENGYLTIHVPGASEVIHALMDQVVEKASWSSREEKFIYEINLAMSFLEGDKFHIKWDDVEHICSILDTTEKEEDLRMSFKIER